MEEKNQKRVAHNLISHGGAYLLGFAASAILLHWLHDIQISVSGVSRIGIVGMLVIIMPQFFSRPFEIKLLGRHFVTSIQVTSMITLTLSIVAMIPAFLKDGITEELPKHVAVLILSAAVFIGIQSLRRKKVEPAGSGQPM